MVKKKTLILLNQASTSIEFIYWYYEDSTSS
jgi:hypothetical protein